MFASDGQRDAAALAYLFTSHSTASVLNGVPCRLGNSGEPWVAAEGLATRYEPATLGPTIGLARVGRRAVPGPWRLLHPGKQRESSGTCRPRPGVSATNPSPSFRLPSPGQEVEALTVWSSQTRCPVRTGKAPGGAKLLASGVCRHRDVKQCCGPPSAGAEGWVLVAHRTGDHPGLD